MGGVYGPFDLFSEVVGTLHVDSRSRLDFPQGANRQYVEGDNRLEKLHHSFGMDANFNRFGHFNRSSYMAIQLGGIDYVIGIDIGFTWNCACILDRRGTTIHAKSDQ